jgi:hypothetical protein
MTFMARLSTLSSDLTSNFGHRNQYLIPETAAQAFQDVQFGGGARAHLGDTYDISQLILVAEEEHHERLTWPGRENPLSLLPSATNAPFNSYGCQNEPTYLTNTQVDILQISHNGLIAKTSNPSSG